MRNLCLALILVAFSTTVGRCDLIQWKVEDGGNGHYYEAFSAPNGISWDAAQAHADLLGGYLATITSAAENQFVFNLVDSDLYWKNEENSRNVGPWLGGFQPDGSAEPSGGWQWLNNEGLFSYTNWTLGEPNNTANVEDRLLMWSLGPTIAFRSSTWNDVAHGSLAPISYVVELTIIAVPEPSSLFLVTPAIFALAMRRSRNIATKRSLIQRDFRSIDS